MKSSGSLFFNLILLLILSGLSSCINNSNKSNLNSDFKLVKQKYNIIESWKTDTVFRTPESVIYLPESGSLIVSNVNNAPWSMDGNGFLSRMDIRGNVIDLEWSSGLNGPKGMGIVENSLFVADVDDLAEVSLSDGSIIDRYPAPVESPQLNDVTVDDHGRVYVSGSASGAVYLLTDGRLEPVLESYSGRPNGLLPVDGNLLMAGSRSQHLTHFDLATGIITILADSLGAADGIADAGSDAYILSDWNGRIFYYSEAEGKQLLLDLRDKKINTADIEYIIDENLLLVPTFFDNRVIAYKLANVVQ